MAQIALSLSESQVLPFDVVSYATFLERDFSQIEQRYNNVLVKNGGTFGITSIEKQSLIFFFNIKLNFSEYFRKAVAYFRNATEFFSYKILPLLDTTE